jgi:Na+-driven multidrug efflux pump
MGHGVLGLLWGLFAGLAAAALLLVWRFEVLSRREVRPF